MSDAKFLISTLLFIVLIFTLVTVAHGFALIVKGEQSADDIDSELLLPGDVDTERDPGEGNYSEFDVSDPVQVAGALFLGIELPMPFPLVITAFNAVCIGAVVYIISEMIRKWIPFISS